MAVAIGPPVGRTFTF